MPAASIAPKAMNSMIRVGRPDSSSALWSASSFILLKSLHTGHSPVTSASRRRRRSVPPTKLPSSPAASGRSLSSPICCSTGINAVKPSWEIIPASAGMASGSATDSTRGPLGQLGLERPQPRRIVRDRGVLAVDDDRVLRAERGEVVAQLHPHLLGGRTLRIPARTRQRLGQRDRQRGSRDGDHEPDQDHRPAVSSPSRRRVARTTLVRRARVTARVRRATSCRSRCSQGLAPRSGRAHTFPSSYPWGYRDENPWGYLDTPVPMGGIIPRGVSLSDGAHAERGRARTPEGHHAGDPGLI